MKTKFSDLSVPLKIAVIASWVVGCIFAISFLWGMLLGILGY